MHAQAKPETTEPSIIEHTRRPARTATRGFSLLEVTLVLVIIGLLIGGAAVAFGPALLRAQERTTKNDMATIKRAIQEYQLQNRSILPQSLADLVPGFLDRRGKRRLGPRLLLRRRRRHLAAAVRADLGRPRRPVRNRRRHQRLGCRRINPRRPRLPTCHAPDLIPRSWPSTARQPREPIAASGHHRAGHRRDAPACRCSNRCSPSSCSG